MEKIDLASLHEVLGISPPWHIIKVELDKVNRVANIHLDQNDKKKLFGLIDSSKNVDHKVTGKWAYMPMGSYNCVIHANVPDAGVKHPISFAQLNGPAFIGDSNRRYSNYILQQVALNRLKGTPASITCTNLRIPETLYQQIIEDLDSAPAQAKTTAFLPTAADVAWHQVLNDKIIIRTNLVPLKLLLSKLKLAAAKTSDADELNRLCHQLRQFFVSNSHQLEDEFDQVCGITNDKMRRQAAAAKQKQKLVLPALKNPVWIDLLTGRLNLNSNSVPLNLLISRQRVAFIQGSNGVARVQAIEILREYVKKNYRTLKPELLLINRAIQINEKTKLRLPNPDHEIWQHILSNDDLVPSEHMAYKLLLAKLRVQVKSTEDPVVKLEAARSIRNFLTQNQKAMGRELSAIVKQTEVS